MGKVLGKSSNTKITSYDKKEMVPDKPNLRAVYSKDKLDFMIFSSPG